MRDQKLRLPGGETVRTSQVEFGGDAKTGPVVDLSLGEFRDEGWREVWTKWSLEGQIPLAELVAWAVARGHLRWHHSNELLGGEIPPRP